MRRAPGAASRRWPCWIAAVVAIAVAASDVTWLVARERRPHAAIGRVFHTERALGRTAHGSLLVPYGRIDLGVTAARSSLPDGVTGDEVRPPVGGRFVGVRWQVDGAQLLPLPRVASAVLRRATVSLIADGRRYSLHDGPGPLGRGIDLSTGQAWVAVRGNPSDVRIAVDYDGVQQSVDPSTGRRDTGRAAPLYSLDQSSLQRSCGPAEYQKPFAAGPREPSCELKYSIRVPYVGGLGWAPAGQAWLAATIATTEPDEFLWRSDGDDDVTYRVEPEGARISYGYEGTPARSAVKLNVVGGELAINDPDDPMLVVFAVPGGSAGRGTLAVTGTYRSVPTEQGSRPLPKDAPSDPTVRVTWRLPST